jgi:hypothetical protein
LKLPAYHMRSALVDLGFRQSLISSNLSVVGRERKKAAFKFGLHND